MMKKFMIALFLCLATVQGFAQNCKTNLYPMKSENAYTHYNVRYATSPVDAKHYTTDRLRQEYLIQKISLIESKFLPRDLFHSVQGFLT